MDVTDKFAAIAMIIAAVLVGGWPLWVMIFGSIFMFDPGRPEVVGYLEQEPEQPPDIKVKPHYTHDVLPHFLLYGRPGLGKTTFAQLVYHKLKDRYGHPIKFINRVAGQFRTAKDIEDLVKEIEYGDVVLIDEGGSMRLAIEELLYSVLQDFVYYPVDDVFTVGELSARFEKQSQINEIKVPKFTCITATTNAGGLSRPFRERFNIEVELQPLSEEALAQIVKGFNKVKNSYSFDDYKGQDEAKRIIEMHIEALGNRPNKITRSAADYIAKASLGTPRISNNLRFHAQARAAELRKDVIDINDVIYAMGLLGIDELGLTKMDRRLIKFLIDRDNKPVGVNALASVIGASKQDITDMVIPRLNMAGILTKDHRSWNVLTEQGFEYYKNKLKEQKWA